MSLMDLADLRGTLRQAVWEHGVTEVLKVLAEVSREIRDGHRADFPATQGEALQYDTRGCVWEEVVKTLDQAVDATHPLGELVD